MAVGEGYVQDARRRPFHLLAKPTGSACNLACDYCFFLQKAALYPGQRQRMSDEVLDAYLRQLFESEPAGPVTVAWQGGEPTLMGLPFFERAVGLAEWHRREDQQVEYTLQTNATLLDNDWAAFLARNRFLVGVSIDGPADVHDAYRRDAAGWPTHARVLEAIRRLDASAVEWNALAAVDRMSEGRGVEIYRFLRDEAHARFIQFIPIAERPANAGGPYGSAVTDRAVSPLAYGEFLVDVFEEWVRRDVGEVYVQALDDALAVYAGEPRVCLHSPTCGGALALEFNGDVYACDHFVVPEHRLGNLLETPLRALVDSAAQRAFGRDKLEQMPAACASCDVRFACNGGCPKDRFLPDPAGGPDLDYLCAGYRAFFRHVDEPMRAMAALLAAGRAPAEVMRWYARRDAVLAEVGRNGPCPCGSGRKVKHCHGARGAAPRPRAPVGESGA